MADNGGQKLFIRDCATAVKRPGLDREVAVKLRDAMLGPRTDVDNFGPASAIATHRTQEGVAER